MANWTEETIKVAGADLVLIKGGSWRPLLILHEELGNPGWMQWNEALAKERTLLIPLQPGFGRTPRLEWIRSYRDLGGFYAMAVRELNLDPVDVIGFSAGGFIAAEMAASDPKLFRHLILVGPMGLKPDEGEMLDIFLYFLDEACYAEELGFDAVALNEHPGAPFCMGGVMNVEAAILARIRKKVKIV